MILITKIKRSNNAIRERDVPLGKSARHTNRLPWWECLLCGLKDSGSQLAHMSASAGRKRGGIFNCRAVTREMEGSPPVNWTLGDRMAWVFPDRKGDLPIDFPTTCPPLMAPGGDSQKRTL